VLPTPLEPTPRRLSDFAGRDELWLKREDQAGARHRVVANEMPVMAASYDAGEVVDVPAGATIADGLAVRVAIPLAVERLSTAVDLMARVSEQSIVERGPGSRRPRPRRSRLVPSTAYAERFENVLFMCSRQER